MGNELQERTYIQAGHSEPYNAAHDLIARNLTAGRSAKIAYIDDSGQYTYAELAQRVMRFASALRRAGIQPEQRVLLCLHDTIDFPTAFLGSIWAGAVPVPVNTLLTAADYGYMLRHSRARALCVSQALLPAFAPVTGNLPELTTIVVSGAEAVPGTDAAPHVGFSDFISGAPEQSAPADTAGDSICFWLYSSGSTGRPKGAVHTHKSLIYTAEKFGQAILGIRETDTVFSAAKLFFAYGLGNALSFPMSVGATSVLMAERPTPDSVARRLLAHRPTIFCGVPTLFAAMLASPSLPQSAQVGLRICTSAGEALPKELGERWRTHFNVDVLDGIGSTEMLHIFLSNRPGAVRYGTTGQAFAGYALRLLDENGNPAEPGEIGELYVKGDSSAVMYWCDRARSCNTFQGEWTKTGDKYSVDADGYYTYAGRSDDMLKVSGIYVSPFEIESALIQHPDVMEAAVIGVEDGDRLIKPKAYVVLKPSASASDALMMALQQFVKDKLAPYKYPRSIEFVAELPKTATGKIQRYKLRDLSRVPAENTGRTIG
jgi:benzoate-CoA ligase